MAVREGDENIPFHNVKFTTPIVGIAIVQTQNIVFVTIWTPTGRANAGIMLILGLPLNVVAGFLEVLGCGQG